MKEYDDLDKRKINRAGHNKPAPIKQCLECGEPHQHNSSWCSADCYLAWRARKRACKLERIDLIQAELNRLRSRAWKAGVSPEEKGKIWSQINDLDIELEELVWLDPQRDND